MGRVKTMNDELNIAANMGMAVFAWFFSYTNLPFEPVTILAFFIVSDFVFGILKSYAIGRQITSQRMRIGIISKFGVLFIPIVLALTAKVVGADYHHVATWGLTMLILSEAYSILGNIYCIRTGKEAPEWDAVSMLLRKMQQLLKKFENM